VPAFDAAGSTVDLIDARGRTIAAVVPRLAET
jgi:hypothetical protein